jgi:hypothetical protein
VGQEKSTPVHNLYSYGMFSVSRKDVRPLNLLVNAPTLTFSFYRNLEMNLTDFEKYARLQLIMMGLFWLQKEPRCEKMFLTKGKGET